MRHHSSMLITAILLCLFLVPAPAAAQTAAPQQGATQMLQETMNAILNVFLDPTLRQVQNKAQRMEKVQALFRLRFAAHTFCERALGRNWQERSEEQRDEFVQLFSNLLVETFLERIDGYLTDNSAFTLQNITYLGERTNKAYTLVTTDVQLETAKKIPVLYRMEMIDGAWKVTDIAIEGISLLKNYRAQFNEIIANAGYDELLKRLKAKKV